MGVELNEWYTVAIIDSWMNRIIFTARISGHDEEGAAIEVTMDKPEHLEEVRILLAVLLETVQRENAYMMEARALAEREARHQSDGAFPF